MFSLSASLSSLWASGGRKRKTCTSTSLADQLLRAQRCSTIKRRKQMTCRELLPGGTGWQWRNQDVSGPRGLKTCLVSLYTGLSHISLCALLSKHQHGTSCCASGLLLGKYLLDSFFFFKEETMQCSSIESTPLARVRKGVKLILCSWGIA